MLSENDVLYVIAGKYYEFVEYCLKYSPKYKRIVYLHSYRQTFGIKIKNYVFYGTFYKLKDYKIINEYLIYCKKCNEKTKKEKIKNFVYEIFKDVENTLIRYNNE